MCKGSIQHREDKAVKSIFLYLSYKNRLYNLLSRAYYEEAKDLNKFAYL